MEYSVAWQPNLISKINIIIVMRGVMVSGEWSNESEWQQNIVVAPDMHRVPPVSGTTATMSILLDSVHDPHTPGCLVMENTLTKRNAINIALLPGYYSKLLRMQVFHMLYHASGVAMLVYYTHTHTHK